MTDFKQLHPDDYEAGLRYEFITELSPGVWKISRREDRMEYLAQDVTDSLFASNDTKDLTPFGELLAPGGHQILHQVKLVLNHSNLVSLVDCFRLQVSSSSNRSRERLFTVWDYCDAGSLGNLLMPSIPRPQEPQALPAIEDATMEVDTPGPQDQKMKFLPESFCWHVLTSVLKALAWLHDGISEVVETENGAWERRYENLDWQPMLHRDITPQNIFLGHPRRREWYGPVKLGNYGSLVVSGHCQTSGIKHKPASSKAIGPPPGQRFARLGDLIAWDATHGALYPHQVSWPFSTLNTVKLTWWQA